MMGLKRCHTNIKDPPASQPKSELLSEKIKTIQRKEDIIESYLVRRDMAYYLIFHEACIYDADIKLTQFAYVNN
jgi:hypothetical protein